MEIVGLDSEVRFQLKKMMSAKLCSCITGQVSVKFLPTTFAHFLLFLVISFFSPVKRLIPELIRPFILGNWQVTAFAWFYLMFLELFSGTFELSLIKYTTF